jgi:hypothetical protein
MSRVTLYITERKRVRDKGQRVGRCGASKMRDGPFGTQGKQARPLQEGTQRIERIV